MLGLRIMGGFDRPQHVFRQGDKPGIFILKILEGGAAEKIGKLRAGDRILKVIVTTVSYGIRGKMSLSAGQRQRYDKSCS